MRLILLATIVCSIACISFVLFKDEDIDENKLEKEFYCGDDIMLTIEIGKPKKHVYLVENMTNNRPHLSCRMWDTYERVSRLALKHFLEGETHYQPVIHYFNHRVEHPDSNRPAQIVSQASESEALAVVGFAWSSMAGVAAKQANIEQMPYISPAGVLNYIFDSDYSISMGTPLKKAAKGFKRLSEKLELPKIFIVEKIGEVQEQQYADLLRKLLENEVVNIKYHEKFPVEQILNYINGSDEPYAIFVPGYTNVKRGISSILAEKPSSRFILGPQWSHDHRLLDFDGEIYCISDYYNFLDNSRHGRLTSDWEKDGGEILGGYLYALYDALLYTLETLNDENVVTRKDAVRKLKNGSFTGTKGGINISDGNVEKDVYILRYFKGKGFDLIESI